MDGIGDIHADMPGLEQPSCYVGGPRGGHNSELISSLPPPQFAVCVIKPVGKSDLS